MDYVDIIIKYNGSFSDILKRFNINGEDLSQGFGIAVIAYGRLRELAADPQVEFLELPRNLELMMEGSEEMSCSAQAQGKELGLTGKGVILGVIDSGIDFSHPDFIDDDGKSRILYILDLSGDDRLSDALSKGEEYDNAYINEYLKTGEGPLGPSDPLGHGTAIAGAMGGNGRESGGKYAGAAPEGSFIVVKLSPGRPIVTVDIMRGVKYIIDKAEELGMPVSINISYGTSNGSHGGNSLFEVYMDSISQVGKAVIAVPVGNEGEAGHHYRGRVLSGESLDVVFNVGPESGYLYLSLWKDFADKVDFELINPNGTSSGVVKYSDTIFRSSIDDTRIGIDVGRPSPYSFRQEVFIYIGSENTVVQGGNWVLRLYGRDVVDGLFDIWLPINELVGEETFFADSDRQLTLTLPSTAARVLSVGAYDSSTGEIADFSGVGYVIEDIVKPDIVAPGVNVVTARAGGGYDSFTGTSIASPIAAGAAALMMEWGIIKFNDPFMYGQRLKAFLRIGATRREGISYPDPRYGYGRLCLKSSVENAALYINYDIDLYFAGIKNGRL